MTIKGNRKINRDKIEEIRVGNRDEESREEESHRRAKEDKRQLRGSEAGESSREREKDGRRSERASERRGREAKPNRAATKLAIRSFGCTNHGFVLTQVWNADKRLDPRDRDCQRLFPVVFFWLLSVFLQTCWCCWYGGTADSTVPDRPRGPYGVFTQDGAQDTYGVMDRGQEQDPASRREQQPGVVSGCQL